MTAFEVDSPRDQPFLPHVSVIIPIYNGEQDVPPLLDCLKAQTYPRDKVEYVLVDNASRDRTLTLLKTAAEASATEGLSLRCLSETQIQSSYAARNTGIKATQTEFLAFTDADCRPLPNWLSDLVQPFVDPAVGIVAGEVLALEGDSWLEQYSGRKETLSQKHTLAHPFYPYGQTANLAVRRQAFEKAGLFRPYLTTGGDADMCWRIQQAGNWKIVFAEQAAVQHRHRATLEDLKSQWRRYGRSNRYLHELHGVSLAREFSRKDYAYRWSRWLLKELPLTIPKILTRRADLSYLLDTPLDLLCTQARAQGQRDARLSEQARQIEWMHPPLTDSPIQKE
ncbi:glycosyltransferase [Oscillatoria sp. FACHB-1407]|uniref:glycosyltransferase n=1 Tax=Oscillatoria sp. FACHB-1407 TaxID=2692847 RepID=UPI001686B03A|nr:glycosyltransferase [Oscillatoria sp. FACHB-1407]MBD2459757.1 glycosyltransferase [Oscillatoria sp. FACHB-1407]